VRIFCLCLCDAHRSIVRNSRSSDVAIVHTGGNDLYHSAPGELAAVVAKGVSPSWCVQSKVCAALASNLTAHAQGLHALGVRKLFLVGVPLVVGMPFIAQGVGETPCALRALGCVMSMSNAALLAAMRHAIVEAQRRGSWLVATTVDETRVVDGVLRDREPPAGLYDLWWQDESHPSQALHDAMADVLLTTLRNALEEVSSEQASAQSARRRAFDAPLPTERELSRSLLPTPREHDAM